MKLVRLRGWFLLSLVCLLTAAAPAYGQALPAANEHTRLGICAFKNKDYALAEAEFQKALTQEPANKMLLTFRARAAYFRFDPKGRSAENTARGRAAIDAYLKLLAADTENDEAVGSIVDLYQQMQPEDLRTISADEGVPKPVRARILIGLAGKLNTCANDITYENKSEVTVGRNRVYKYHMPKDPADFAKAEACASDGLKLVGDAISLVGNDESSWSYKTSLLIQLSRLAEMQNKAAEKAKFDKESADSKAVYIRLADESRARQQAADDAELQRLKTPRMNAAEGAAVMENFYTTGRLREEPEIDLDSIESPLIAILDRETLPEMKAQLKGQSDPPAASPWKMFTSPDGGFSAMMPASVEVAGKGAGTMFVGMSEGVSYTVTISEVPRAAPVSVDKMLPALAWTLADIVCGRSVVMAKAACEVDLSRTLTGAHPGIEYSVSENDCVKIVPGTIRVYGTPQRIYGVMVIGAELKDPRSAKFFDSFSIKR
jgi:tetratricopeptide (TPR) repeat protein